MSFLTPLAFLFAALIPPVVLLYFLRLRRPELEISSTYLWRRAVHDLRADAPWQKLRPNLLLFLQILFLILAILALARPFNWEEGISSDATIIIIDSSASMAATDIEPNRLEAAKDQAHRFIDDLPAESILTIIQAGEQAGVLVSNSIDRRAAHAAIDNIRSFSSRSAMEIALQIASAIASRQQNVKIMILSDGGVQIPNNFDQSDNVLYYPIGQRGENQAISQLTINLTPSGEKNAFAQVSNFGNNIAHRRILFYADNNLFAARDIKISPGESEAIIINDLPEDTLQIEAILSTESIDGIAIEDDLALDDHAHAVFRIENPVQVTLVTSGNRFLETAVQLIPNASVSMIDPNQSNALPSSDLTIIDGKIPTTSTISLGNILFIGPLVSTDFFTITGKLENPIPIIVSPSDPIVDNLKMDTINILDSAWIDLPEWAKPNIVAKSENDSIYDNPPLLFTGQLEERRIAVIAFDLHRSDLPLQIAFPILFANLSNWLLPELGGEFPSQVALNQPISIPITPGKGDKISITRPDGQKTIITAESGVPIITDTNQIGIYQVEWLPENPNRAQSDISKMNFAVNLFSPQESRTTPVLVDLQGAIQVEDSRDSVEFVRHEWWRTFVIIAIIILMIEWMVYHRSTVIHVYQRTRNDLLIKLRAS